MTFKFYAIDFKYQCRLTWLQETSVVVEQYLGWWNAEAGTQYPENPNMFGSWVAVMMDTSLTWEMSYIEDQDFVCCSCFSGELTNKHLPG